VFVLPGAARQAFRQRHEALIEHDERLEAEQRLDSWQDHARFFDDIAHLLVEGICV
jgi:hypothetical protein